MIPDQNLGQPLAAARMTRDEALQIAKNDHWSASLFTHPITVQYGSYTDPGLRTWNGSTFQPLRTRDVWKITITGLSIPRPGGPAGNLASSQRPPPVNTLTIFIDDKTGNVLKAEGF